jgi:hypothetical protein
VAPCQAGLLTTIHNGIGCIDGMHCNSSRCSLQLDAEELDVARLSGYALGAAGDDDSNDRQVGECARLG